MTAAASRSIQRALRAMFSQDCSTVRSAAGTGLALKNSCTHSMATAAIRDYPHCRHWYCLTDITGIILSDCHQWYHTVSLPSLGSHCLSSLVLYCLTVITGIVLSVITGIVLSDCHHWYCLIVITGMVWSVITGNIWSDCHHW